MPIAPHAPRGNAFRDALRRKRTRSVRNCMPARSIGTIGTDRTCRSSQAAAAILLISRCPLDETCKVLDSSVVRSQPI